MMDIFCNDTFVHISQVPFYLDEIFIELDIKCKDMNNKIILFSSNPRINIDCIIYMSEFNFNDEIDDETYGQITSKLFINYNTSSAVCPKDESDIIILTKGKSITGVIITLPKRNDQFLRELLYRNFKKFNRYCVVCYENKKNCVKVHNDHYFCMDCILKFEQKQCPICRHPIL